MEIIIAGAGKVGFHLARTLSVGHSVTVIDKNAEALHRLQESLDILPMEGNIEDPQTYARLGGRRADLFVAVTDLDEANLLSTLIVDDALEVERKIIRLRNRFFAESSVGEKLGIDTAVFPLQLTSETVVSLLDFPRANNVKRFRHLDLLLVSVRAERLDAPVTLPSDPAVVGIERGKRFFVPDAEERVEPGDLVYLFGRESAIRRTCAKLESETSRKIERCVVFGAGELGVAIASELLRRGREVRLVEKDPSLCEAADEQLGGRALTFSCKYGTAELFEEEGLRHADMVIAATDNDEYNIIKCLEAGEYGVGKVVAINNEQEYYNLMHALGIVVVRGPKMSAYHAILESIYSGVTMERRYCGGRGTIYLRYIREDSLPTGKSLRVPRRLKGRIFVVDEEGIWPIGSYERVKPGVSIVGFCESVDAPAMKLWFHGL